MSINTIYTPNKLSQDHLLKVISEMKQLGSPIIRVVDCGDHYQAIEGCHRIEAARQLGIPLTLDILDQDDVVESDSLDLYCLSAGEQYTAGEIAGECYHPGVGCYRIDEDGMVDLVFEASV